MAAVRTLWRLAKLLMSVRHRAHRMAARASDDASSTACISHAWHCLRAEPHRVATNQGLAHATWRSQPSYEELCTSRPCHSNVSRVHI